MIIGTDLDDILVSSTSALINFYNNQYGTAYKLSDHRQYGFSKLWHCSLKEEVAIVLKFFRSPAFHELRPIPEAIDAINQLSVKHQLYVISSRPNALKNMTEQWVNKYFPGKFEKVIITNQFSKLGEKKVKKSVIAQQLQIRIVIEDNLEYAFDYLDSDIKVYLFDEPWNQSKKLPKNIVRVSGWQEVVKDLKASGELS